MPTFGQPINSLAMTYSQAIPPFLEKLFAFMINKCLDTEGIFRVPGGDRDIKHYHSIIDATGNIDLPENASPFVVANLITRFIRMIPNHLLIDKNANELAQISTPDQARSAFQSLPLINKALFSRIMAFATLIIKHESKNRMSSKAVSLILSPILVEKPNDPLWIFSAETVEMMLKNYNEIFSSMPALTPEGEFMTDKAFQESIGDVCSIFFCQSTATPISLAPVVEAKQKKMCRSINVNPTSWDDMFYKLLANERRDNCETTDRLQQI